MNKTISFFCGSATKMKPTSTIWNFFTCNDDEKATCNICDEVLSHRTSITNLRRHLRRKHPTTVNSEYPLKFSEPFRKTLTRKCHKNSILWKMFTPQGGRGAVCNVCKTILPNTSTINLQNHIERRHPATLPSELKNSLNKSPSIKSKQSTNASGQRLQFPHKSSVMYDFFTKQSDGRAACNFCKLTLSYKSSLKQHLMKRHTLEIFNDSRLLRSESSGAKSQNPLENASNELQHSDSFDDEENIEYVSEDSFDEKDIEPVECNTQTSTVISELKPSLKKPLNTKSKQSTDASGQRLQSSSVVWNFYTKQSESGMIATCNFCKFKLSYQSTTDHLKEHLTKKHPLEILNDLRLLKKESAEAKSQNLSEKTSNEVEHSDSFGMYDDEENIDSNVSEDSFEEKDIEQVECTTQMEITDWKHNEIIALINLFSLHKNSKEKGYWSFISRELFKIGMEKTATECEYEWNTLVSSYQEQKTCHEEREKYEIFKKLDCILSDKNQSKTFPDRVIGISQSEPECFDYYTKKQKRHEDRMDLMRKKIDIEERKVKAFEDYLQFLKQTHNTTDKSST